MITPFGIWWDNNMQGYGVSADLRELLAKAFEGGRESVSSVADKDVKIVDITEIGSVIRKEGGMLHDVGKPRYVTMWPTPPSVRRSLELGKEIPTVTELLDEDYDYEEEEDYKTPSKSPILTSEEISRISLKMLGDAFDEAKVSWDVIAKRSHKEAQLQALREKVTKVKY